MTPSEYNELNSLLSLYSKFQAELQETEAAIVKRQLEAAQDLLPDHGRLQIRTVELAAKIKTISEAHYAELFADEKKRTHETPFGSVAFRKTSYIDYGDEEKVILKIKAICAQVAEAALKRKETPRFVVDQLIHTHEQPNLRALESLDDADLALFGVERIHKDNFKIAPFEMQADKPAKAKAAK